MSSSAIGLVFLLIFALSQGLRDALFGNVFQSISFFLVTAPRHRRTRHQPRKLPAARSQEFAQVLRRLRGSI